MASFVSTHISGVFDVAGSFITFEDNALRLSYAIFSVGIIQNTALATLMATVNSVAAILSIPNYFTTEWLSPPSDPTHFVGNGYVRDACTWSKDINNQDESGVGKLALLALLILNPSATLADSNSDTPLAQQPFYIAQNDLTDAYKGMADQQVRAMRYLKNGNWFNRHITTRLAAPLMAIAFSVAAVVRIAVGVVAWVFALGTLGLYESLNTFAVNNIAGPGFISNQLLNGFLGIFRTDLINIELPPAE